MPTRVLLTPLVPSLVASFFMLVVKDMIKLFDIMKLVTSAKSYNIHKKNFMNSRILFLYFDNAWQYILAISNILYQQEFIKDVAHKEVLLVEKISF